VAANLLQPLDLRQIIVDQEDYHAAVAAIGQIDGQWWGMPAAVEVLHVVYGEPQPPIDSWRFDDLLAAQIPLLFPAASVNGLSPVFLLQYVTAGSGTDADNGGLSIDENALRTTLRFYERAADEGLITPTVLEYDLPSRYPDALVGDIPVVITSSMYMQAVDQGLALNRGYVPTLTGQTSTVLDGWVWVITSTSTEQQTAALRFLNWMLDAERQSTYANAIHMLPALRASQRQIDADYAAFVESLLETVVLALPENTGTLTARTLQNAYAAVINGQSTTADAVTTVLAQVGS
jgi:ABC-type glycerol-3-phosphate transport system substrate-binding protein